MKSVWVWAAAVIAVFAPIKAAAITAIVLVMGDLVTGVLAARKRGEPITSSGLKTTVGKILVYETAIALGFLAQTYLTGSVIPVSNLITTVVGLTEMKSVLENLDTISGGNFFTTVVAKLTQNNKV